MDPLSLAASVAGLVSLADLVFRTATKYWKEVKDSRKDVDELLSEVKGVSILLHDLSLVAFSLEIDPSQNGGRSEHSSHLKLHHLYECQKLLRQLEQSLNDAKKKFNSPSSLNKLQSRLKWPFSSREMSQIVQSIQRHKQAINVALTADSVAQLKDRIMTQLVSGAKGMFRWVACQLDHLCELPSDKARRRALERLPPTLPATYERILLRVEACAEEVRVLVQRCLLLLASGEALTTREICEAVSISHDCDTLDDDDILDENEILRWCGSLVRKSSNGYEIEFAHFTVKEFLQDSCPKDHTLSFYAVSHEKIYQFLGSICLYYMTLEDYDHLPEATENEIRNILTREKSRPFYRRAASSWPRYVHQQSNECQGGTLQYLFDLFQTHKTKKFCLWAIEFIRDYVFCDIGGFGSNPKMAIWVISSVLRPDFTPLHMAAALSLPDLCTHLLERGAKVNLRGEFGTPLHCATAPNFMFSNGELDDYQYDWDSNARRRRTVQVLLSAGANVNLQLPARFSSLTTLSISVLLSVGGADPEVIADLISAEIDVEEKDIELFEFYYADLRSDFSVEDFKDSFNGGQAFTHLLRVLGDHEGMNTSRSRLYAMTLDFSKHMELDPKLFDFPSNDATDDEVHAFLDTVISSNDVLKLEQFVQDGGSESLKRLKFDSMWTPIHLATIFGSLDVLAALMEVGCDPNDVDNDGQTPVQLCGSNRDEDVLRVLLKHGGSTVLPDKNNKTIWHTASEMNSCRIIKVLVEQDERDQGLQMESDKHGTPICTAIACGQEEAALILLPHCNTKEFWKSKKPIYRQAAKLGSITVLKKILDTASIWMDLMRRWGILCIFLQRTQVLNLSAFSKKSSPSTSDVEMIREPHSS